MIMTQPGTSPRSWSSAAGIVRPSPAVNKEPAPRTTTQAAVVLCAIFFMISPLCVELVLKQLVGEQDDEMDLASLLEADFQGCNGWEGRKNHREWKYTENERHHHGDLFPAG